MNLFTYYFRTIESNFDRKKEFASIGSLLTGNSTNRMKAIYSQFKMRHTKYRCTPILLSHLINERIGDKCVFAWLHDLHHVFVSGYNHYHLQLSFETDDWCHRISIRAIKNTCPKEFHIVHNFTFLKEYSPFIPFYNFA